MRLRVMLTGAITGALVTTAINPTTALVLATERRGELIRAVAYDPAGADTAINYHLNREVVRVTNNSARVRRLTGWTLREKGSGHVYRFSRTRLRPGQSVTVHTGRGDDSGRHRYWDLYHYVWDNTGGDAVLRNRAGRVIVVCSWRDGDGRTSC